LAVTVGITGSSGQKLQSLARYSIVIDSTSVQHVEDATMVAGHVLCLRVKEALAAIHLRSLLRPVASSSSTGSGPGFAASAQ
jgi:hypothetical protein